MKKKLTITIDENLYNVLVGLAAEANRSLSNYIETVLREHEQRENDQEATWASRSTASGRGR